MRCLPFNRHITIIPVVMDCLAQEFVMPSGPGADLPRSCSAVLISSVLNSESSFGLREPL